MNKPRGLLVQKSAPQDESLDQMVVEYLIYKGEYNPEKDRNYTPHMAFIKNNDRTYYKNKPVKVTIEER